MIAQQADAASQTFYFLYASIEITVKDIGQVAFHPLKDPYSASLLKAHSTRRSHDISLFLFSPRIYTAHLTLGKGLEAFDGGGKRWGTGAKAELRSLGRQIHLPEI